MADFTVGSALTKKCLARNNHKLKKKNKKQTFLLHSAFILREPIMKSHVIDWMLNRLVTLSVMLMHSFILYVSFIRTVDIDAFLNS